MADSQCADEKVSSDSGLNYSFGLKVSPPETSHPDLWVYMRENEMMAFHHWSRYLFTKFKADIVHLNIFISFN